MREVAAAGAAFLLAVLWFDLMFDTQVRAHGGAVLPADVLGSISAYYRRVTTTARPMNRLVAAIMLVTLGALVGQLVGTGARRWVALASLAAATVAVGLALARTVPDAVRLGAQVDRAEHQTRLARGIYRSHVVCLVAMSVVLVLQLVAA